MGIEEHSRHFLTITGATLAETHLDLAITTEALVDGFWYSTRILPGLLSGLALAGTETVYILNNGVQIQLVDWRGRQILSERILKGGERLRMVYTKNSVTDLPIFLVREGIIHLP